METKELTSLPITEEYSESDSLLLITEKGAKRIPAHNFSQNSGGNAEDGFSPIATVEQTATGAVISITDKDGTTTATITNGKDGADGAPGETGPAGPQGEVGPAGPQGPQGETGPEGPQGSVGEAGPAGPQGEAGKDGAAGKSAYAYAQEAGYAGTEEEFGEKLARESSGIHVGPDAPTNENINVWIDTDEEPEAAPAGKDGKSAYEYAKEGGYTGTEEEFAEKLAEEYPQPDLNAAEGEPGHVKNRTHWCENGVVVIFPETELTFANNQSTIAAYWNIVPGNTYTVTFDGTEYQCVAFETQYPGSSYDMPIIAIGNAAIFGVAENTGEPFLIGFVPTTNTAVFITAVTSTVHTVGIKCIDKIVVPLPDEYIGKDFVININKILDVYLADKSVEEIVQAIQAGKNVYAVLRQDFSNGNIHYKYTFCYLLETLSENGYGQVVFSGMDDLGAIKKLEIIRYVTDDDVVTVNITVADA